MSTERVDYVIHGMKFPFRTIFPQCGSDYEREQAIVEKYAPYEDNCYQSEVIELDGLTIVSDGMNCEYVVIGKVIQKALIDNGGGLEIMDACTLPQLDSVVLQYRIEMLVGKEAFEQGEMGTWVFTHWR
jgi:hypothetical protein